VRCGARARVLLFLALIAGGVSLGVPRVSLAASAPRFGALSLEEGEDTTTTQADTAQAVIKPEGLRTEYEFRLAGPREGYFCESRVPCAPATLIGSGYIEAGLAEEKVDADATGLEGVRFYTWWVTARNSDGVAESEGSVFETKLPLPVNEIQTYEPEHPAWAAEWAQRSSELRVAEYQAAQKVKAEQEQAAREAAQRAAQSALAPPAVQCVVPSLTGHTLSGARWLLARAHCKLGRVSYLRRRYRTGHIVTQNPARGTHAAAKASVSVRLIR
jgi:hypothetical protein